MYTLSIGVEQGFIYIALLLSCREREAYTRDQGQILCIACERGQVLHRVLGWGDSDLCFFEA